MTYFLDPPSVRYSGPMGDYSSPCSSPDDFLDPEGVDDRRTRREVISPFVNMRLKREGDYYFDENFTSVDGSYDDVR